ncbi:hypothetical protein PR048_019451 [Dryococelus australis]|uniref:Uncharacterized protein n=1 Tax=Dryococelus australis TaxID=614101 RepID=A0ABQ9H3N0_9NEOP|nr:hypothetical protein PR048_019451 [Dryococelus australis]
MSQNKEEFKWTTKAVKQHAAKMGLQIERPWCTRHNGVNFVLKERIQVGNRCFYSLRNTLKSRAFPRRTMIKI